MKVNNNGIKPLCLSVKHADWTGKCWNENERNPKEISFYLRKLVNKYTLIGRLTKFFDNEQNKLCFNKWFLTSEKYNGLWGLW